MGGKIIGTDGNVLFEFEKGQNLEVLLSGLIQRAKFSERFDNEVLANDWVNQLLKSLRNAYPSYVNSESDETDYGAPTYFIEKGMTQKDWDLQDFFYDITVHLSQSTNLLNREGWKDMKAQSRQEFLRKVIFPLPISTARLDEMIQEIDFSLEDAVSAYNPDY